MKRAILLLLTVAAGCCLPKDPVLPPVDVCNDWKAPVDANHQLQDRWWTLFEDPCLDALIEQALTNSPDIWLASERIQAARALEGIAFSPLLPSLTFTPGWEKSGVLFATEAVAEPNHVRRALQQYYNFPFNLQYELDFWGKFRYRDRAAEERVVATEFDYVSVLNILTTDLTRVYLALRTFDEEIGFLEKAVELRKILVEIKEKRVKASLESEVELTRTLLELSVAEAELIETTRLRQLTENELATLLGESASCFSLPKGSLPQAMVKVEPGLPCELLLRRPDLNAQHRLIRASLFEIGVANASFFPSFSLTGALGAVSPDVSFWFTWHSRFWAYTLEAVQQVFTGFRLTNEKKLAVARFHEQQAIFQKLVYRTFQEVENALSESSLRQAQFEKQEQAVFYARETAYLARQLYQAGLLDYLQVANSDRIVLESTREMIRLKGSRYTAAVALIKALGGSFTDC